MWSVGYVSCSFVISFYKSLMYAIYCNTQFPFLVFSNYLHLQMESPLTINLFLGRPNKVGLKCRSVRPQKVSSISMKFSM